MIQRWTGGQHDLQSSGMVEQATSQVTVQLKTLRWKALRRRTAAKRRQPLGVPRSWSVGRALPRPSRIPSHETKTSIQSTIGGTYPLQRTDVHRVHTYTRTGHTSTPIQQNHHTSTPQLRVSRDHLLMRPTSAPGKRGYRNPPAALKMRHMRWRYTRDVMHAIN